MGVITNLDWFSLNLSNKKNENILKRLSAEYLKSLQNVLHIKRPSPHQLEDFLTKCGFSDQAVTLGTGTYIGWLEVLSKTNDLCDAQEIKDDKSTVWNIDFASGKAIAKYVNKQVNNIIQFVSEEKMPFKQIKNPIGYGLFDDFDGSKNPHIWVTNLQYSGVGGVIHEPNHDEQVAACGYLPFHLYQALYIAEKDKGTYEVVINPTTFQIQRILLENAPATMNNGIDAARSTPTTEMAHNQLYQKWFYEAMGYYNFVERVAGGIAETISGLRDNRQMVMNMTWSHQADYLALLLSEAGSKVHGQNWDPMLSTSYAMLAINPSFSWNTEKLLQSWTEVMTDYQGRCPGKVKIDRLSPSV